VYAQELEVGRKEKRLAKKEEHLNQREEVVTELQAKLSAFNKILEEQRVQQTVAVKSLQKLQRELKSKARDAALAKEKLKAKGEAQSERRILGQAGDGPRQAGGGPRQAGEGSRLQGGNA
jgi:septal ring factor EnvC (AmiA/AmiB activator)